jgi:hypothetical protein
MKSLSCPNRECPLAGKAAFGNIIGHEDKSAIARAKRIAWNTVDRWLQKAAYSCRRFNDQ